jgi:NDP-sugar pyrophosphorylase family protein
MKAMILAAGLGTRLSPLTDNIPKALVEINGTTLLERTIKKLSGAGFNEIIINVHHFSGKITDYLVRNKNFGAHIEISDESSVLLDTGGGIKKAAYFFTGREPFIVHNVDVISSINLNDLLNNHISSGALATLAVMTRKADRYLLFSPENKLCGWTNVTKNESKWSVPGITNVSYFAFSGIHVLNPEIFPLIKENGVFSVIDLYLRLSASFPIKAYVHDTSFYLDLGKPENINIAASEGY